MGVRGEVREKQREGTFAFNVKLKDSLCLPVLACVWLSLLASDHTLGLWASTPSNGAWSDLALEQQDHKNPGRDVGETVLGGSQACSQPRSNSACLSEPWSADPQRGTVTAPTARPWDQ